MSANTKFEKSDRVEFDHRRGTVYGTVVAVAETVTVIADGGKHRFGVPAGRLRFSGKAKRKDAPHPMDRWQIASFTDLSDGDGECAAYSAIISRDGVPAISATNAGYGAPDRLAPLNGDFGITQDFTSSVEDWLADNGDEDGDISEPEKFWITFKAHAAPYGVLAAEAVDEYFALTDAVAPEPEAEQQGLVF